MKRESMIGTVEILLFDILQELKQLNQKLQPKDTVYPIAKGIECKYCGGSHENKGQILACARKKKKSLQ